MNGKKKIEKNTVFICEKCERKYNLPEDATKCEKNHKYTNLKKGTVYCIEYIFDLPDCLIIPKYVSYKNNSILCNSLSKSGISHDWLDFNEIKNIRIADENDIEKISNELKKHTIDLFLNNRTIE